MCYISERGKITDRNNNANFVASMTADNNMNPFFHVNQISPHEHRELSLNHSLNSQE